MRTQPNYPRRHTNTVSLLGSLIVAAIMLIFVMAMTSCTVTTARDGTVTRKPDYNAWLEITRLILSDEVPPLAIPVSHGK